MTATADKPWFAPIPMRCAACRADYTGWTVAHCTFTAAAAWMRARTCPLCGSAADRQTITTRGVDTDITTPIGQHP